MQGLKYIRQSIGMTQADLAQKMGVTQSLIAMWERGAVLPNAAKLPGLADALHCTIDALYGRGIPKNGDGAAS